jgi:hypothetical protein
MPCPIQTRQIFRGHSEAGKLPGKSLPPVSGNKTRLLAMRLSSPEYQILQLNPMI